MKKNVTAHKKWGISLAALMSASLVVAGCGGGDASSDDGGTDQSDVDKAINSLETNEELHASLPEKMQKSDTITVVMPGVNEPWWKKGNGGADYEGAGAEMSHALAKVLGVKNVKFQAITDISSAVASVASGRYDVALAPYGDTSDKTGEQKRENVKYVDIQREIVPFLVPKGNPKNLNNLFDLCGDNTITGQVNGAAYNLLKDESKKCKSKGKKPFEVTGTDGVPNGVLAVRSKRADAFFSSGSGLAYYAQHSNGELELAGEDNPNGFDNLYQGFVLPEDSEMIDPTLKGMEVVFEEGVYEKIMDEYGLEKQKLDAPGLNLAAKNAKGED